MLTKMSQKDPPDMCGTFFDILGTFKPLHAGRRLRRGGPQGQKHVQKMSGGSFWHVFYLKLRTFVFSFQKSQSTKVHHPTRNSALGLLQRANVRDDMSDCSWLVWVQYQGHYPHPSEIHKSRICCLLPDVVQPFIISLRLSWSLSSRCQVLVIIDDQHSLSTWTPGTFFLTFFLGCSQNRLSTFLLTFWANSWIWALTAGFP